MAAEKQSIAPKLKRFTYAYFIKENANLFLDEAAKTAALPSLGKQHCLLLEWPG